MRRLTGFSVLASYSFLSKRYFQPFKDVPMGPPDPILGLTVAYNEDPAPNKVNLGVGVYRCDDGKPFVLECVKEAEKRVVGKFDHEYAPITGLPSFVKSARELAFGEDSPAVAGNRIASSQSLSGTGALRLGAEMLSRFAPNKNIYIPSPTWGNHMPIFRDAGLKVGTYSFYDPTSVSLKFDSMLSDLGKLEAGSIVLLHACAHNPTGIDPTKEQWHQIADVIVNRNLVPFVDMAYQGFASGDPTNDAYALRLLTSKCDSLVSSQSFAKSFGLYGQRCGAVHILCPDHEIAEKVLSQLKILIRPMYSNPPLFGARVVAEIFKDQSLRKQWSSELKAMADRMNNVRGTLVTELKAAGSTKDWSFLTKQIGMMAYTGMTKEQVLRLREEHHIYMTADGRAAISGLNSRNVKTVAAAFHAVTK